MDTALSFLDPEGWVYRMMRRPGFRQWWQEHGRDSVAPEFYEFAERLRVKALADGA